MVRRLLTCKNLLFMIISISSRIKPIRPKQETKVVVEAILIQKISNLFLILFHLWPMTTCLLLLPSKTLNFQSKLNCFFNRLVLLIPPFSFKTTHLLNIIKVAMIHYKAKDCCIQWVHQVVLVTTKMT